MMMKNRFNFYTFLSWLILSLLLFWGFVELFGFLAHNVAWDINLHGEILLRFTENGSFPVPPGYPFLVWINSWFDNDISGLVDSAVLVLASMMLLKFWVICLVLYFFFKDYKPGFFLLAGFSMALMVVSPVYSFNGFYYFGRIALTVWHNPTTISVVPFAILLFFFTPVFLDNPGKYAWIILLAGFLNVLIKPSFLFGYIPGVFAYAVLAGKRGKDLFNVFLPLFLLGLMIIVQYVIIYEFGLLDKVYYGSRSVGILLRPFLVWNHFLEIGNTDFITSILVSLLFPLFFFMLYFNTRKIEPYTWLALAVFASSLFFTWMLAEGGERIFHGNFLWTSYIANLVLFIAVFVNLFRIALQPGKTGLKIWIMISILLLHVVSGAAYLLNIILDKTYT